MQQLSAPFVKMQSGITMLIVESLQIVAENVMNDMEIISESRGTASCIDLVTK
jgi:hypothetical protein